MKSYRHLASDALAAMLDLSDDDMFNIILEAGEAYMAANFSASYQKAMKGTKEFWKWWTQVVNNRCDQIISEIIIRDGDCWYNERLISSPADWISHMLRPSLIKYYPNPAVVLPTLRRLKKEQRQLN